MSSVLVYVDAFRFLAIKVSSCVRALVDDKDVLALLLGKISETGSIEPRSDYQIIVFLHLD